MSSGKKLAKFGLIYTIANGVQKGIGFIVFMYLASLFTVEEYALFGIYYAIFAGVATISFAGITESVVSLLPENKEPLERKSLFQAAGSVFLLLSCVALVSIYLFQTIGYYENYDNIYEVLIIIFSSIVSSYFLFQAILVRLNEGHIEAITFSFIPQAFGYGLGFCMAYYYGTAIAYFSGSLVGHSLGFLVYKFPHIRFTGFSSDKISIRKLLSRLVPFSIVGLISWFLGYGITFVIDYHFSKEDVAVYVFLYTIASIIQLVATSMNQVWAPRFYGLFGEKTIEFIEKQYDKFTMLQGAIIGFSGFVIVALLLLVSQFTDTLGDYVNKKDELFLLFGGYLLAIPWWHCQNYFFINNKGKKLLKITTIAGVVGLSVWMTCMMLLGKEGIYVGFLANMAVRSALIYVVARKEWKIGFDWKGLIIGLGLLSLMFLF
ncbi:MAG: O-antigen/teichoic acid export membrane protein [Saprospiraceae bacterium]|jgi:O-antigen/teichoic acid export membrane protein